MAADNVIDELQLKINANASTAIRSLNRLQTSLSKTASAISGFSNSSKSLGNFGKKINMSGISTLETRLTALGRVGSIAMNGLSKVFSKSGSAIGRIVSGMVSNFNIFSRSARSTSLVATSLKTALGALFGIRGITGAFNWVKEAVTLGGDITEIDHIVESVFTKNMVGYVHEWASSAIEEFGIAEAKAKQYAGTLTSMFQASQVGVADSGKMAMDLVGLAGDLSAFYNIDTETAYNKIKSGMAGMVRPLRDLGIDLTAATLEEFRLAQGIQTSYREMTQAEKVMLRYQYLMANTKTQQGDFARTNQSLANSMRTLRAYAQSVTTQIGVGLASAIRHVVLWLNELMKYLLKAATAFATFMQTIFGKYKGGASGIAMEGLGDSADYADDLADGAGAAADGLSDAADSAKQLKKDLSVLPFDELNQLNKDRESSGSGSGGSGGGGGAGIGGIGEDLLGEDFFENSKLGKIADWLSKWADEIKTRFKAKDWEGLGKSLAKGLNKGLQKVYDVLDPKNVREKVFPWIDAFTSTFNSFIANFDFNLLGRTLGRAINDIAMIYDRIITGIDWKLLGSRLADGLNGLVDEIDWRSLGKTIGDHFMIAWNTLYGFVHEFDWANLGKSIGNALNGLNDAISWSTVADAITTGFNGVFTALSNFVKTVNWKEIAQNITDGLNTAIHNTNWYENGKALGDFIRNLCDTLISIIDNTDWEGFGRGLAIALQQIPWGKMLQVVGKVIVNALGGILRGLASTPAGTFAGALMAGMLAFKYKNGIKAVVGLIAKLFSSAESAGLLAKAGSGLGQSLISGFTSPVALATAGVAAFILGLRGVAQAADSLRGGNGVITQVGAAFDDLIGHMASSKQITSEQADELFMLKENMESAGASTEEIAKVIIAKWTDMGGSAQTAKQFVDELANSGRMSAEDFKIMSQVFEDTADAITVKAGDLDMSGAEVESAFTDMRNALLEVQRTATDSVPWEQVIRDFDATQGSAANAQDQFQMLKGAVETYGGSMDDIIAILSEKYPVAAETYSAYTGMTGEAQGELLAVTKEVQEGLRSEHERTEKFMTNSYEREAAAHRSYVEQTVATANEQATALEDWQNNVQAYRDGVLKNLQEVGEGWGTINSEQAETLSSLNANLEESISQQQTALENMRILNNSGLDEATVQAILNQVDPASSAMTDLIQHMQADDSTWQTFHSNIQSNMDLKDDLGAVADGFATEYAKAYAPEFVKIGEDFKVEGGKVGKFSVEGVVKGVYDNTDDAVNAIKKLAYDMQSAYQTADEQHSPSKKYQQFAKNDVDGFIWGIQTNTSAAMNAIRQFVKAVQDGMSGLPDKMRSVGQTGSNSFVSALEQGLRGVDGVIRSIQATITGGLQMDLYAEGQRAGQSFADGFSSIYIPTPHMYVSSYTYHDLGDGDYMYTPSFSVQWYRAGGLFKGGKGQMIGIAEGGRDEAVLPLEDSRAMSRIGTAIADAGGYGDSNLAREIAYELAQVLISNNEDRPINLYAELKLENNEAIARAALEGIQSIDYRNNPTPAYGY